MWAAFRAAFVCGSVDPALQPASGASRVAVLLSGAQRTLDVCLPTLKKYVIDANPAHSFEFFAYLTADNGSEGGPAQAQAVEALLQPHGPAVVQVVPLNATEAAVQSTLPGILDAPVGRGTATGKALNIAQMFWGIAGAARLLYEAINLSTRPLFDETLSYSAMVRSSALIAASPRATDHVGAFSPCHVPTAKPPGRGAGADAAGSS